MPHPTDPRRPAARLAARHTDTSASASIRGAVGIIVMLMLAWSAIVTVGLH